jgi:hypothetical protein
MKNNINQIYFDSVSSKIDQSFLRYLNFTFQPLDASVYKDTNNNEITLRVSQQGKLGQSRGSGDNVVHTSLKVTYIWTITITNPSISLNDFETHYLNASITSKISPILRRRKISIETKDTVLSFSCKRITLDSATVE